jgi:hypothetical protein
MKFQIMRSFNEKFEQTNIRIVVDNQHSFWFVYDDFVHAVTVRVCAHGFHNLLMEKKRKMEDLNDLIDCYGRPMVNVDKFDDILAGVPDRRVKEFGHWLNKAVASCKNKMLEERYEWECNDNTKSEKEVDWGVFKRIYKVFFSSSSLWANMITIFGAVKRWII